MITVKRNQEPPAILKSDSCREKIKELLENTTREFSDYYYRHETVRESLYASYHKKCAYCESQSLAVAEFRIDHYRPKRKLKDEPHPGYYWLAYEWSNLLPVCDKCNNTKSNVFPIAPDGKRVMEHIFDEKGNLDCLAHAMIYRDEKPLLLHPEIDEPEKHLIFLPDGTVKGITERGEKTIEICALNRVELILTRQKIIDDIIRQIEKQLLSLINGKQAGDIIEPGAAIKSWFSMLFSEMLEGIEPGSCYSRLGWFMFKKFELFIIRHLREKTKIKEEKLLRVVEKEFETFMADYSSS